MNQEEVTTANIYAPNIGTSQYTRQILTTIKGEINSNRTIVGNLVPSYINWQITS